MTPQPIDARCPACAIVRVVPRDITVRVDIDDQIDCHYSYAFICPCCGNPAVRAASRRVVDLLVSVGCRVVTRHAATAMPRPITEAEVVTFRLALDLTDDIVGEVDAS